MSKIYRHEKLTYTGDEKEEIVFKVKMISNGNFARTNIETPNADDLLIVDSGKKSLGLLKSLTKSKTAVYCSVKNPTPIADNIIVDFYVNNTLIHHHDNLKTETEDPFIILKIKFIKS